MHSQLYPYSPLGDHKRVFHQHQYPYEGTATTGCGGGGGRASCGYDNYTVHSVDDDRGQLEKIDMQSYLIDSPHENDVLMGRGGKNNQHSGNEKLRSIAKVYCAQYHESSKKEKSNISRKLVDYMRELDPPARFLKRDSLTGRWEDVGDDVAREKASQVLRDAVALLLDGDDPKNSQVPPSVSVVPSGSWGHEDRQPDDSHSHTHHQCSDDTPGLQSDSSRYSSSHHSNTLVGPPTPLTSSSRTKRPRGYNNPYEEDTRRTSTNTSRSFDESYYVRPPSPIRRRNNEGNTARHHPYQHYHYHPHHHPHNHPTSTSSATTFSSSPTVYHHPTNTSNNNNNNNHNLSRLALHRRRSSATEASFSSLYSLSHANNHHNVPAGYYSEFDLFNGQLLESDTEDRGY